MSQARVQPEPGRPVNRRGFLLALGSGAGLAIAGYFLLGRKSLPDKPLNSGTTTAPAPAPAARPALAADVQFGQEDGKVTVSRGQGADRVVCAVNPAGEIVLRRLDGRHSMDQVAQALADALQTPRSGQFDAQVGLFMAQLGMAGLLAQPFYAMVYAQEQA